MPRTATRPINIRNWPVFGMYEPDAIAAYHRARPDLPRPRPMRVMRANGRAWSKKRA